MQTLTRETFETRRESEYFTQKELIAQIGHGPDAWPISILRELIDNALDACEMTGASPEIAVTVADDKIIVADNGPGIPPETLIKSMDYMVRVSDKAYYISPTRGQMGNALKVVWAAPFVMTGECHADIATHGEIHRIDVAMDRIAGVPKIEHTTDAIVKNESFVSLSWRDSTGLLSPATIDSYKEGFFTLTRRSHSSEMTAEELISQYVAFNPHATFIYNGTRYERTDPDFKKWKPDAPISAHWYTAETLRDLIAGYIVNERAGGREKTVREFVSEFRGLSGTKKQAEITAEWRGAYLHDFITADDIDPDFLSSLLLKMREGSTPPKPAMMGKIGEEHLSKWMIAHGATPESIHYACVSGIENDLPHVVEIAFAINTDDDASRQLFIGMNWSPTLGVPDQAIQDIIQQQRIDSSDPVLFLIHMARPRFEFMDRGKTRLEL